MVAKQDDIVNLMFIPRNIFFLSGSYGRPPRQPQQAAPAPISPADPWQVGSPANMASIKDLQVIVEFVDDYLIKIELRVQTFHAMKIKIPNSKFNRFNVKKI